MQTLSFKKSTFWVIIAAVVLAGIVAGLLISSYAMLKNRVAFCTAFNAPRTLALSEGQSVSGTVISVSGSQIVLQVSGYDQFNPQTPAYVSVNVPVNQKDLIVRPEFISSSSVTNMATSSISEIKAGDVLNIKGLANGAKIIYLPIINK